MAYDSLRMRGVHEDCAQDHAEPREQAQASFVQRFWRLWLYSIIACGLQVAVKIGCLWEQGRSHRVDVLIELCPIIILAASLMLALLAWHVVGKRRCLWRSVLFVLAAAYWFLPLHALLFLVKPDISYLGDSPAEYFGTLALGFGVAPCVLAAILWLKSDSDRGTNESRRPLFDRLWGCSLVALALEIGVYTVWQVYDAPARAWFIWSHPVHWALIAVSLLVLSTWLTASALWLLGKRYFLWRGVLFVALLSYGFLPFLLLRYLATGEFSPAVFYKLPLCFGTVPLCITLVYRYIIQKEISKG